MLKCLRQLADSGWFGSNWNTRDWERLRDVPLKCRWNIHEHVARTYRVQQSCSVFAWENLISFIRQFLDVETKGWGWISSYMCRWRVHVCELTLVSVRVRLIVTLSVFMCSHWRVLLWEHGNKCNGCLPFVHSHISDKYKEFKEGANCIQSCEAKD